jgi:hypothetical protein
MVGPSLSGTKSRRKGFQWAASNNGLRLKQFKTAGRVGCAMVAVRELPSRQAHPCLAHACERLVDAHPPGSTCLCEPPQQPQREAVGPATGLQARQRGQQRAGAVGFCQLLDRPRRGAEAAQCRDGGAGGRPVEREGAHKRGHAAGVLGEGGDSGAMSKLVVVKGAVCSVARPPVAQAAPSSPLFRTPGMDRFCWPSSTATHQHLPPRRPVPALGQVLQRARRHVAAGPICCSAGAGAAAPAARAAAQEGCKHRCCALPQDIQSIAFAGGEVGERAARRGEGAQGA